MTPSGAVGDEPATSRRLRGPGQHQHARIRRRWFALGLLFFTPKEVAMRTKETRSTAAGQETFAFSEAQPSPLAPDISAPSANVEPRLDSRILIASGSTSAQDAASAPTTTTDPQNRNPAPTDGLMHHDAAPSPRLSLAGWQALLKALRGLRDAAES